MHHTVTYSYTSCVKKASKSIILKDAAGSLQVTAALDAGGVEHTQHTAGFTSNSYLIQKPNC